MYLLLQLLLPGGWRSGGEDLADGVCDAAQAGEDGVGHGRVGAPGGGLGARGGVCLVVGLPELYVLGDVAVVCDRLGGGPVSVAKEKNRTKAGLAGSVLFGGFGYCRR